MTRYLITADPARTIQPAKDTTLRIAAELLSRGIEVDYSDLLTADVQQSSQRYLENIPVQKILSVDPYARDFMPLGETRRAAVTNYDVILHRKDPPVDAFFISSMHHYAQTPERILQINSPLELIRHSEKELATLFPDYVIPTHICTSLAELERAVRAQKTEAVVKPFNESSGIGIQFLKPDVDITVLEKYWTERQPKVIVQPYLDEITKSGDLRIFVMNTQVVGAVLRVPKVGSRLGNFYQGATAAAFTPTPWQLEAARVISGQLQKRGLYLLGLDFIGNHLSEINVTSPTCIAQINEVMNIRGEKVIVDECEGLRKKGRI